MSNTPSLNADVRRAFELASAGRYAEAEPIAARAARQRPRDADALYVLGCVLRDLGKPEQGIYQLGRGRALRPNDPEMIYALGVAMENAGRMDDAARAYLDAQALSPQRPHAFIRYADLLLATGQAEQATLAVERTIAADPATFVHKATGAAFSCYSSSASATERARLHREAAIAATLALPKPPVRPLSNDPDPDRPLRVAYLSPDFLTHSVTYFFEPILDHVNQDEFAAHCYFSFARPDATTARLRAKARAWRDFPAPTEEDVVRTLQDDRIDIAIDLAGLSTATLVWALRQRVVPVQATYLGYPHSTGLETIDYRIVDSITDPAPSADVFARERLLRLDPCFLCFRLPDDLPMPPARTEVATCVTFGSFNVLAKVSEKTRRLWASVLDAVPGSRLLLKDKSLATPTARAYVSRLLASAGIDPQRVDMLARTPTREEHLALYSRVDLCLDPTPYCGTTTTCEAAMLGVPTLTLAGEGHVERVGASINAALGLTELVATSEAEYVRIAAERVGNAPRLAGLRASMRERLRTSPLCDGPAFARRWERALREMWREWCAQTSA